MTDIRHDGPCSSPASSPSFPPSSYPEEGGRCQICGLAFSDDNDVVHECPPGFSEDASASVAQVDQLVVRPESKSLEDFMCWLNCWGNEQEKHDRSREYLDGYADALSDVWKVISRGDLIPDWMDKWPDWMRGQRGNLTTAADAASKKEA